MSYPEIAKVLNIGKNTAIKACEFNMNPVRLFWSIVAGNSGYSNHGYIRYGQD